MYVIYFFGDNDSSCDWPLYPFDLSRGWTRYPVALRFTYWTEHSCIYAKISKLFEYITNKVSTIIHGLGVRKQCHHSGLIYSAG